MTRVTLGLLLGVVIGGVDVLLMLPLTFPDKRAALLGAFCARFALGFLVANVRLPVSPILSGVVVGVLTSLPDALITKASGRSLAGSSVVGAFPNRRVIMQTATEPILGLRRPRAWSQPQA